MDGDSNSIGDGHCDDENNNVGCHFDDGDCGTTTTPIPTTVSGGGTVYVQFLKTNLWLNCSKVPLSQIYSMGWGVWAIKRGP